MHADASPRNDDSQPVADQAPVKVAIIGLGARGLCVLERLVDAARRQSPRRPLVVYVVEPGTPGCGIYDLEQPDYLTLNTPCEAESAYPYPGELGRPDYAVGLYDYLRARGLSWHGDRLCERPGGRPVVGGDFVPRRAMGEYLSWFYRRLVDSSGEWVRIEHRRTVALDVERAGPNRERVRLADGNSLVVDWVVLTCGHVEQRAETTSGALPPYPVTEFAGVIRPGVSVAIAGMGMVALDVVLALTVGRGGSFDTRAGRLVYRRSGHEPAIKLFSRSGLAYAAKPVHAGRGYLFREPVLCTDEAVDQLLAAISAAGRGCELRDDLLPLILAEMTVAYYAHAAAARAGAEEAERVALRLSAAWERGRWAAELRRLSTDLGEYDAQMRLFRPDSERFPSAKHYEAMLISSLDADLEEASKVDFLSPLKAADEALRRSRRAIRRVVDFGGLSPQSYRDVQASVRPAVTRLIAGPPAERNRQLRALFDAGVVEAPFGPSPTATRLRDRRVRISSRFLDEPHEECVDVLVRGHLGEPVLAMSCSPLVAALAQRGRLVPMSCDGTPVGSVALSRSSHPLDASGAPAERLVVFGPLTEGARFFTHYAPAPSRPEPALEASATAAEILATALIDQR